MNRTLPPARDLPPGRQAEIRAQLERAVTARRAFRYAPLITATVAVVAVVAAVAFLAPWQRNNTVAPAQSTTGTASATTPAQTRPVIPGLSPQRVVEIEEGCPTVAGVQGQATLYQYVEDEAGKFGLLYTRDTALDCTIDGPAMPFNSGLAAGLALDWLPGHFSVDHNSGMAGGDVPGNKSVYRGQHGWRAVSGRVSPEVARVTYTNDGRTVEATVANGTYVARIVHPTTWAIPEDDTMGEIRAYDSVGRQLGSSNDLNGRCFVTPEDRKVIHSGSNGADPATCAPATRWR
ncbi:hypothetical protein FHS29_006969 [Saccharothrix tamanrassetensis]|uniref:Uncharacterized protein n=1 Tax=Saccharothrix tamanrassetensis TaxID=1051531 RepID=A0A841CYE1_9PSEU|nr:hypothetical protein [Saccharothrix tamanrassetensis]MBB5960346.1 hypothetical protein [Saccharothrix tamanrassetensis]